MERDENDAQRVVENMRQTQRWAVEEQARVVERWDAMARSGAFWMATEVWPTMPPEQRFKAAIATYLPEPTFDLVLGATMRRDVGPVFTAFGRTEHDAKRDTLAAYERTVGT